MDSFSRLCYLFSRLCYPFQQALLTFSAGHDTCSAGFATLLSRLYNANENQGSARPDFDHPDREWTFLILNEQTKTETKNILISMTGLKLRPKQNTKDVNAENPLKILLICVRYQQDRDWTILSLNDKTKTKTKNVCVSMMRLILRPKLKTKYVDTETPLIPLLISVENNAKLSKIWLGQSLAKWDRIWAAQIVASQLKRSYISSYKRCIIWFWEVEKFVRNGISLS